MKFHRARAQHSANIFQVPTAADAARQLFYGLPFTATSDGGVGCQKIQKDCGEFPYVSTNFQGIVELVEIACDSFVSICALRKEQVADAP